MGCTIKIGVADLQLDPFLVFDGTFLTVTMGFLGGAADSSELESSEEDSEELGLDEDATPKVVSLLFVRRGYRGFSPAFFFAIGAFFVGFLVSSSEEESETCLSYCTSQASRGMTHLQMRIHRYYFVPSLLKYRSYKLICFR